MPNTSHRNIWVSSSAIILHQLQSTEDVVDESALEYHESCNQAWRAQYKHPVIARMGIGFEFVKSTSRCVSSLRSTQDNTVNHGIGYSCLTYRCRI